MLKASYIKEIHNACVFFLLSLKVKDKKNTLINLMMSKFYIQDYLSVTHDYSMFM